MLEQRIPLPILVDSGIRLSWRQAVALVQAIAAVGGARSSSAQGSESFNEFALDRDGVVVAVSDADPALSVSALALLLGSLLPGEGVPARDRAPAGVQFAIARALGLVPAPSFSGVEEFSRLLARFEGPDRSQLLREVFDRYANHAAGRQSREMEGLAEGFSDEPVGHSRVASAEDPRPSQGRPPVERRRTRIAPDVARRLLREADQQRFDARHDTAESRGQERAGLRVDMLRRFLREADRREFEAARTAFDAGPPAAGRNARAWSKLIRSCAAFAVLALLIAAAAIADHQWHASLMREISAVRESQERRSEGAPPAAAVPIQPAAEPGVRSGATFDPARSSGGDAGATVRTPGDAHTAAAAGTHSRSMVARRGADPPITSPRASASASRSSAAEPVKHVDNQQASRSAPIRFFRAIGRKLFSLVGRQPAASREKSVAVPSL